MKLLLIIAAGSVGLLASALNAPATQPALATATTQPATRPTTQFSRDFSRDYSRRDDRYSRSSNGYPVERLRDTPYALLESRSIFYHGKLPLPGERSSYGGPTTRTYQSTTSFGPPPERSLVFEGATDFDNEYVSFIEDFTSGKVQILHTGDPIANGKVGIITLNSMDYINKSGKTTHVALGKNLEGTDPPTTQPSYIAASSTPGSTVGSTVGSTATPQTASSPPSASLEATLARLRAKRAAEGGN
jgi:hypothetical protein